MTTVLEAQALTSNRGLRSDLVAVFILRGRSWIVVYVHRSSQGVRSSDLRPARNDRLTSVRQHVVASAIRVSKPHLGLTCADVLSVDCV